MKSKSKIKKHWASAHDRISIKRPNNFMKRKLLFTKLRPSKDMNQSDNEALDAYFRPLAQTWLIWKRNNKIK